MTKTLIAVQKAFDPKSPGFITTVLSAILAITASIGIDFGLPPDQLAGQIIDVFNSGGLYAVAGLLIVNVVGPIWNFIRKKQPVNWKTILSSTTTIVSLGGVVVAALVYLWGINIPADTPKDILAAIAAKNWALLASYAVANIIIPIVRYFKDKAKTPVPAQ